MDTVFLYRGTVFSTVTFCITAFHLRCVELAPWDILLVRLLYFCTGYCILYSNLLYRGGVPLDSLRSVVLA